MRSKGLTGAVEAAGAGATGGRGRECGRLGVLFSSASAWLLAIAACFLALSRTFLAILQNEVGSW
jgi:hypothetical protein